MAIIHVNILPGLALLPVKNWRILLEQFYCPHDLADGNYCIQIMEKTLEFSSTELHTSPLNHSVSEIDTFRTQSNSTKQDIKVHQALTDAVEKVTCTDTYVVETL